MASGSCLVRILIISAPPNNTLERIADAQWRVWRAMTISSPFPPDCRGRAWVTLYAHSGLG